MKYSIKCLALLVGLFSMAAAPPADAQDPASYELLYGAKRDAAVRVQPADLPALTAPAAAEPTGFDVVHYVLDITIDPGAHTVAGSVYVTFAVTAAVLDTFSLYLKDNMNVTAVELTPLPLVYTHANDRIAINLGGTHTVGDTLTVRVAYDGMPVPQGLRFNSRVVYNLSEPDMARNWFPCYDEPWDKATSEMICTVPDDRFCASNGLLVSVVDNLDGTKTYHWNTRYPHSTYLTSVAISDYVTFSQWHHFSPTDSMEMPYYVYPDKLADAQVSFAPAPAMMGFFSDTFGRYPFSEEVYGTALAEVGGAMENFTCTTYGQVLVTGDNRYDWVVAHEMAHSWFGNSVTLADWREVWLNEGFATYGDALWHEHTGGPAALASRMANFKDQYFAEDSNPDYGRFPMYDPDFLWGATVYEKGAWVLHMLRYVVGDTAFFDALRTYHQTYAYSNATTEDLRSVFESASGMDLFGFFDEWVYQAGYPEYEYAWRSIDTGGGYRVDLHINQVQSNAPVFTIPIEVRVTTVPGGDTIFKLPVTTAAEFYQLDVAGEPVALSFDPSDRILKTAVENPTGIAADAKTPSFNVRLSPNPTHGEIRFTFFLDENSDVVLDIYDVAGRHVGRMTEKQLPARWNTIDIGSGRDGVRLESSGVYFYRLSTGGRTATGKFAVVR